MIHKNKLISVLSDAEQEALYGLPDFDDGQRLEFLSLSETELAFAGNRPSLPAQVYCFLQIGYFKAKHAFFRFDWNEVEDDCTFVLSRYFHGETFERKPITKHEHYTQREGVSELFGYRLWTADFLPQLGQQATQAARRDMTPGFVAAELIVWLNEHKIIRPGYTTLQELVSETLSAERRRLGGLLAQVLDDAAKNALAQLLVRDDTLSQLAALKQDAKNFGWRQMIREREKRALLEPLHRIAKALLPKLGVSQQNLLYFASLANFYTVHDLRNLKADQTQLYLLCYAWLRYRQLSDNLVDAMAYHMKQLEEESSAGAQKSFVAEQVRRQQDTPQVGRLLLIYVDDTVADATPFGDVRQRAYKIMPKDTLQLTGQRMSVKPVSKLSLHWQAVDGLAERNRRHLRPLYVALDFSGTVPDSPWLKALAWAKSVFAKQQRLSQRPLAECPVATLPKRLRPYLLTFDADGKPTGLHADRYEFWLYRQIRKRFKSGELYLDDSLQHRHLSDELVSMNEKADTLAQMDIPFLRQPVDAQLDALTRELRAQLLAFNRELKRGKLTHLTYDKDAKTLIWHKPKGENQKVREQSFYEQLPYCDVADVFRFVNGQCHFLSALTPLQPRYAKKVADADSLMAVVIAQAMNHGNQVMARTSDIPYHVLETTYQQYLRQASLQAANGRISNAIAALPIFPHYSFDLDALYGAVDGQKFSIERPTVKARHSRKYFGRGKGVVAYTLLCNHVPLNGYLIGAHDFEAHHVFDIWYRNTSDVVPTAITGDMHSVNKANFAILHWFGPRFEPRFTNLEDQLQELYSADDPALYEKCLIRPVGQIDQQLIISEKPNIDQIVATLGLKEMTQGTLIRKLCTYTAPNPTRRAIFEFDKLIRSIYTLRYLRDPQLERNVHRSQNRVESYHQLRSTIAQVGGKKELTGRTDIGIEISNQCARLIANAIIYYNSAILSHLLTKCEASGNAKAVALITKISPAAWRHILLNGHYTFQSDKMIDLDALLAGLELG
ncbi:Tn3 family transposase [Pseudomonas savastanoi pv. retacarpa]|uniref:Tn3-like element ISPsy30 family transposase n=2 Tax=Pseudomonas savastanoi TaxID=29438 RepID=UPI000A1F607A|nr:Tn3-like element ISPsy30 family transposase [Pseudomonas savastanoi]OSR23362.1 Tn3 family transposase [Pseudomonas savastanoi pv. retacarpa]PAB31064.1 Tn3 family transposase [Pseudomonas savastanoi]